jgi:hypothetical protein
MALYSLEQILGITDCFQPETAFAINVKTGLILRICGVSDESESYILEKITKATADEGPFFSGTAKLEQFKDHEKQEWILTYVRPLVCNPNIEGDGEWNCEPTSYPIVGNITELQDKVMTELNMGKDYQLFWSKFKLVLAQLGEIKIGKQKPQNFYNLIKKVSNDDIALLLTSPCDYTREKVVPAIIKEQEFFTKIKKAK